MPDIYISSITYLHLLVFTSNTVSPVKSLELDLLWRRRFLGAGSFPSSQREHDREEYNNHLPYKGESLSRGIEKGFVVSQFLSMKLASVNPVLYDFGMDLDDYMVQPEKMIRLSPPMPSVQQQFNHVQATAFGSETTNNYPMLNNIVNSVG
ncbi:hypothetical protein QJS10_CPB19g01765 [Acorus calamus]|uniref:Uncharacterized protein n=1 Tax=Acorus calamus TaxID=4465 RepID=A0AAV9CHA5_ACOCL|nr:hypothetical protein QJS10_CPB19g01765 [Acorus calamus]